HNQRCRLRKNAGHCCRGENASNASPISLERWLNVRKRMPPTARTAAGTRGALPIKRGLQGQDPHDVERDKPLTMNLESEGEETPLPMNLESSAADKWNTRLGSEGGRNPFGVVDLFPTIPRVARSHVERGKPRNPGLRGAIPLGLGQFASVSQGISGRFIVD